MAQLDKDSCEKAYMAVKKREARYCTFQVEQDKSSGQIKVTVAKVSERKVGYKDFLKDLPENKARFACYDYEFRTSDGRSASTLYFMQWMPENVNQNDRILYSTAKKNLEVIMSGMKNVAYEEKDDIVELLSKESIS